MSEKQYKSIFVTEQTIDLANYITELLIKNYILMVKKPLPTCPFWRKEIAANDTFLQELSKRYALELIGIKNLLKVFDGNIITKYIIDQRKIGFKMLKKENQAIFLYDLFNLQIKKPAVKNIVIDTSVKNTAETFTNHKKLIGL